VPWLYSLAVKFRVVPEEVFLYHAAVDKEAIDGARRWHQGEEGKEKGQYVRFLETVTQSSTEPGLK